jgi:hypothetical protein
VTIHAVSIVSAEIMNLNSSQKLLKHIINKTTRRIEVLIFSGKLSTKIVGSIERQNSSDFFGPPKTGEIEDEKFSGINS